MRLAAQASICLPECVRAFLFSVGLRKPKERGVYAASAWSKPKDPVKFLGGGTVQTLKRPKGRAPGTLSAAAVNTYANSARSSVSDISQFPSFPSVAAPEDGRFPLNRCTCDKAGLQGRRIRL